jgi:DNA-binding transcriptional regulator YdaS (Cro superfamily)
MPQRLTLASVVLLLAVSGISAAQTLQTLTNQPPDSCLVALLMTDGTVLCQGILQSDWWKLTPDVTGSYVNGT